MYFLVLRHTENPFQFPPSAPVILFFLSLYFAAVFKRLFRFVRRANLTIPFVIKEFPLKIINQTLPKLVIVIGALLVLTACSATRQYPLANTAMVYESGIVPILKVAPEYPSRALARGMEGDVGMKFGIDNNGRPHSIMIIDGLDNPLDSAAVEALSHAVFNPDFIGDSGVAIAKFRLSEPLWK